uniref:Lactate/malate dehydrogenase N-terminal domain-containing protein n=1 Tax=Neovison vison TaxID=452646 RepID=A0A8C7BIE1_NEOVI
MGTVRCEFTKNLTSEETIYHSKISTIGTGSVGIACAISILLKGLSDELAFVDADEGKMKGETVDLQHGSSFIKMPYIVCSIDYHVTANSNLVIMTAVVHPGKGETCFDVVKRNVSIFKLMISNITWFSPQCKMIVVSNPVDILTYVSWKLMNIAGIPLKDLNSDIGTDKDPDDWENVHREVITCGCEMIKMKGYTNWAVCLSVADLTGNILKNLRRVHTVSTITKGLYEINEEVFVSVPCILGGNGIANHIKIKLTPEEESRTSFKVI